MRLSLLALAVLTLVNVALTGCQVKVGNYDKDRAAAVSATRKLQLLYNEEKDDQIYRLGSPDFQRSVPAAEFRSSLASIRLQAGKQVSSRLVAASCFPNEVRLVYHSQFATGPVTEYVLWVVPGDVAQLVSYRLTTGHEPVDRASQKGCPT